MPSFGKLFLLEAAVRGSCGGILQEKTAKFGLLQDRIPHMREIHIWGNFIYIYTYII